MHFKHLTYIFLTMHNEVSNTCTLLIRFDCCEVYTRRVVDMTLLTRMVIWGVYIYHGAPLHPYEVKSTKDLSLKDAQIYVCYGFDDP